MKMCVASAPNAVREVAQRAELARREKSACDRSQTKNSVLPGLYSQRMTMLPRSDLRVEVRVVRDRHRVELERLRPRQPPDVVVVADGDERLQVGLHRQVAA